MAKSSWTWTVSCCLLTTLTLCIMPVHAQNITYWMSFSKLAFEGESLEVKVCVKDATGPFNLTLELMDDDANNLQNPQTFTLAATDDVQTVNFKIAKSLTTTRFESFYIRARAMGGKVFEGFQKMHTLNQDRHSVIVQTDRRVYFPGQKVRFRALSMNRDLKVIKRTLNISIYDREMQLVAKWKNIESKDDSGVIQGEMMLAAEPLLSRWGKWQIHAHGGETFQYTYETRGFEVIENEEPPFDVPLFDVQIRTDKTYALTTQEKVTVTVQARHLYDVPVQGTGLVTVTSPLSYGRGWTDLNIAREFKLDDKGQAVVEFTTEELTDLGASNLYGYWAEQNPKKYTPSYVAEKKKTYDIDNERFTFVAEVTEELSGITISADTKTLQFYDSTLSRLQFMAPFATRFKKGLPYRVVVQALQPGGLERLENPEQYTVKFDVSQFNGKTIESKVVRFNSEGIAEWEYDGLAFPDDLVYIGAYSQNGSAYTNRVIFPVRSSPSNTYLQLSLKSARAKIGQKIKIQGQSNKKFGTFTYQVFSKSRMFLTKKMTPSSVDKKQQFEVTVTDDMYPVVDVVVFFEAEDGEVVADRLVLPVEGVISNELSLKFRKTDLKLGSKAKLNIRGSRGSTVFLLGLDESVKGHDVTRISLEKSLSEMNQRGVYWENGQINYFYFAEDSRDVFRTANVGFISDGTVPGRGWSENIPRKYRTKRQATTTEEPLPDPPRPFDAPKKLMKLLPDTWLWDSVILRKSSETVEYVVPDMPTTWVVNAFAVHHEGGLTIAKEPVKFEAIARLHFTLPKSVLRGEDICFSVYTMNTESAVETATLTLAQNSTGFDNTLVELQGGSRQVTRRSTEAVVNLGQMRSKERRTSSFCINPKVLGSQPVQVTLKNNDRLADRQVREFKVLPEGVRRSQSYPFLIELRNKKTYRSSVTLDIPKNYEKDSLKIYFQIHGNLLGIPAKNQRNLLGIPTATGDQNVVNLAPAVYVYRYLNATNSLTKRMDRRIKTSLLLAYQTQLKFRQYDESFSAFGNRDSTGNTWILAAVLKSLAQAAGLGSEVFNVDKDVIDRGIYELKFQQSKYGNVSESGRAYHPKMKSGSLGLAAFCTIAFHEVIKQPNLVNWYQREKANDAVRKGVKYLEKNIASLKDDAFDATIVAYALTLTGSSKADDAIRTMDSFATKQGNLKYWSAPMPVKTTRYAWYRHVSPLSIEMTSYALMTYALKGRLSEELAVFRWLNNQRGPHGGFYTLSDTLVGLEALSKTNVLALGRKFSPIEVEISWVCKSGTEKKATVTIDRKSVNSLQEVEIPVKGNGYPRSVTVTAKTSRKKLLFAFGQVFLHYNLASNTSNQSFTAMTTVKQNKAKTFDLTTCVRRTTTTTTNPSVAVAKIAFPSGFDVDTERSDFGAAGHVEFLDRKAILYYAWLSTAEECSVLRLRMTKGSVANHKPVPVRVFDLYAPDDEYTTMYSINQFSICQVEQDYMDC